MKKGYSDKTFHLIDWNTVKSAGKSLTSTEQTWLMKQTRNVCATGCQQRQRKYWCNFNCSCCNEWDKNAMHILACCKPSATMVMEDNILILKKELKKLGTHPGIIHILIYTLFDRGASTFVHNIPDNDVGGGKIYAAITIAAKAQDMIPFHNIFEGHIMSVWRKAQDKSLLSEGKHYKI